MKNTKTTFQFFTVPEWKEEEAYLQKMHGEGWRFIGVTFPGLYHFERCEPEAVVYQLDYNQDGIANHEEYVQMFCDCGWEYLTDFVGYSYFRKPVSEMTHGDEEIFCDDDSRMDMIQRVFKGRIRPLLIIFFCCILTQLPIQGFQAYHGETASIILFAVFLIMFILYMGIFVRFGYCYWKLKKSMEK